MIYERIDDNSCIQDIHTIIIMFICNLCFGLCVKQSLLLRYNRLTHIVYVAQHFTDIICVFVGFYYFIDTDYRCGYDEQNKYKFLIANITYQPIMIAIMFVIKFTFYFGYKYRFCWIREAFRDEDFLIV